MDRLTRVDSNLLNPFWEVQFKAWIQTFLFQRANFLTVQQEKEELFIFNVQTLYVNTKYCLQTLPKTERLDQEEQYSFITSDLHWPTSLLSQMKLLMEITLEPIPLLLS